MEFDLHTFSSDIMRVKTISKLIYFLTASSPSVPGWYSTKPKLYSPFRLFLTVSELRVPYLSNRSLNYPYNSFSFAYSSSMLLLIHLGSSQTVCGSRLCQVILISFCLGFLSFMNSCSPNSYKYISNIKMNILFQQSK